MSLAMLKLVCGGVIQAKAWSRKFLLSHHLEKILKKIDKRS
jgi:hypothetical protein